MNGSFRRRISSHNRHVAIAAILSLLGAWLTWPIAYALFAGIALGLLTIIHGQEVLAGERLLAAPAWLRPSALAAALVLLIWEAVHERRTRFHPVSDRPVVGWHLAADFLLLPARLTFGFGHQLGAIIRLSQQDEAEARELLRHIYREKRCPAHSLGAWSSSPGTSRRLLAALQLAGWIDLLKTEDGWIYIPRSAEAEELDALFAAEPAPDAAQEPGESAPR